MKKAIFILALSAIALVGGFDSALAQLTGDADGNGTVNIVDALQVSRYDARLIDIGDFRFDLSDVDGSGDVSIVDALQIARFDARLITQFTYQVTYVTLDMTVNPIQGGTVEGYQQNYISRDPSDLASFTAVPTPGWKFSRWEGIAPPGEPDPTSPTGVVVMDMDRFVTAHFVPADEDDPEDTFILQVAANPFGFGIVDVETQPLSFQLNDYVSGTRVRLVATPIGSDIVFVGWRGDVELIDQMYTTVVMDDDKNIVADFERALTTTYTLSTTVLPTSAAGEVLPDTGSFERDSMVTLTAIPTTGYVFDHWVDTTNNAIEYPNPVSGVMERDWTIEAHFSEIVTPTASTLEMAGWIILAMGLVGTAVLVATRRF